MKFVIVLGLFAFVALAYSEEFQCVQNVPYMENECNLCQCIGKILACTHMACPYEPRQELKKCQIGTTWTKGCNRCWCAKGYGTVCENYYC